ncbi:MAG: hypothetical protein ACK4M6_06995 [Hyphomonas sp.]
MCSVAWCSFSWEAFATIFTGVFAVVAASVVGIRQVGIQTKLVDLEKLKVEVELFDRRLRVYEAAVAWFKAFIADGLAPAGQVHSDFWEAIQKSKFLFRSEVSDRLAEYLDDGVRHRIHTGANRHNEALEIAQRLIAASNGLHDLFGAEMKLVQSGEIST